MIGSDASTLPSLNRYQFSSSSSAIQPSPKKPIPEIFFNFRLSWTSFSSFCLLGFLKYGIPVNAATATQIATFGSIFLKREIYLSAF
ncbi:unknown protein [Desulfotalea psychrophila LSv54]|uniref:Uncharacterized protein n=1 Tax=Desulfotalea psychrophila (strain LSv54 / DSM 12343) TaxID=177439 RepID=Q6ALD2_DESPS|nr:unknown protein [Desulfotalea psychrophila LSv54]